MANPGYVRSTDGDDADNGSTWALANATLAGAITDAVAGDTIYVSQVHAESTVGGALTFPGTLASPVSVICANDAAEPPTAVATSGAITITGSTNLQLNGSAFLYGLAFSVGATGNPNIFFAGADLAFVRATACSFSFGSGTSTGSRFTFGSTTAGNESSFIGENCTFGFNNASQAMLPRFAKTRLLGGSISGAAVTNLIAQTIVSVDFEWSGGDLSAGSSSMNLLAASQLGVGTVVFRNCKLPASWSGSLLAGAPLNTAFRAEMYNCDSSDTNYRLWVEDYAGSIRSETTIVRTGGASDGTTSLSWKMASSANAEYPLITLDSPEIARWNDTTGSAITVTVEVVTDNVTLTDAECWLEVQYLGTSGFPLGTFVNDCKADFLASAANQTSSSETWTTTGLGTPVKQKLSVTFTPQEKGYIHAVVKLAKASTTVYVDPLLTVT